MYFEIVLICCACTYFAVTVALAFGVSRLKTGHNRRRFPVSVIVVARNEAHQIDRCLAALSKQDYPRHLIQMILVNDRSEDSTAARMDAFCEMYGSCTRIDILHEETSLSPKKYALAKAISKATGKALLFTDADCQPSPQWISRMIRYFEPDVVLTAGFSPLVSGEPGWWSKILELDSLASAIVAAGSIGLGSASTCTGRNLAFTREAFNQTYGYAAHQQSLSGDDDLLLQNMRRQRIGELRYAMGRECLVPALPVTNFRDFIRQRKRHFSAGRFYTFPLKLTFFAYHLSNLMLFIGFVSSLLRGDWLSLNTALFSGKLFADFCLMGYAARKLYHPKILRYFLPWEFYFVLYNTIVGPAGVIGKIRWK
ncbi:glycosyltransferase [candidate division KSB1 bacterium]|nr:glycosyltransferase [candidate division KSB1 bacterium]